MFYFNCSISCFTNNNILYFNNEFFVAKMDQNRVRKKSKNMKRKGWTNCQAG